MKGIEALQSIIFIIASIAALLVLITLAINLTKPNFLEKNIIGGDKEEIIQNLKNFIYKCWENNKGHLETKICFKIYLNSSITITEDEILDKIDTSIISKDKVKVESIRGPTNLVVEYKKDFVSLESR